ncbi:phage-like protein [Staphylococcus epidermidis]|nr:phage-like protein [Staphylococcus epidermidis]
MQTKKTNMLKLKLQFFAEEPGDNAQTSEGQEKQDTPEKVYSEEEFNQRLNSELQRRLKQKEDEKAEAVKEAQKLAKMNKDQQLQYENEKLTKQLEEYKVRDAKSQMKDEARLMLNKECIDVTEEP